MTGERPQPPLQAFGSLQRFVRRPSPQEQCELCGAALAPRHEHLLEVEKRRLACCCQACAILFSGQTGQRYKRVPGDIRYLAGFQITDGQWQGLNVPINMAFFFRNSTSGDIVAMYPSPAGATESQLPGELWQEIAAANPALQTMQPDVEALLVNRLGRQHGVPLHQYFILPIDQCFKLVGLVRTHWRGFSGGSEVWAELNRYFAELAAEARHA